ncbi:MAG: hypothetical protein FIA94_09540 [Nitrospirae bacterium]|nr:hypothetical protein [Nitrospirota bacterium]
MNKTRKRLGELLLEAGLIDHMQLNAALSHQRDWGGRVGAILVRKGFVTEKAMVAVIEKQMGMRCMPLEEFKKPANDLLSIVKEEVARKFGIFPLEYDGKTLVIATADPTDLKTLDDLGFQLNVRLKPVLALESDIYPAIDYFYNPLSSERMLEKKPEGQEENLVIFHNAGEMLQMYESEREDERTKVSGTRQEDTAEGSVLAGLIDILVEKGIFTRDELADRIRRKK